MTEWKTIDSAPMRGTFYAPDRHGDLIRVRRFIHPSAEQNEVINSRTGRIWKPKVWIDLPDPLPSQGDVTHGL